VAGPPGGEEAAAPSLREWLPPIGRREFWAVQLLVLFIAGGHVVLEATSGDRHGGLSFIPTSLFLIPVIYAALAFGLHGSLPTAVWSALLTIPNLLLFHHDADRLGEVWQIGLVIVVAAFVGRRVDQEQRARRQAEEREQARRESEERYRGIFDHAVEPILLVDGRGVIESANEAAGRLFASAPAELLGRPVGELVEIDLRSGKADTTPRTMQPVRVADDRVVWVEPVLIPLADNEETGGAQLMLRDLTPQYERQRELEAYARRTTAAREEERARIARELHDGPVQTLVLLWRRLDALEQVEGEPRAGELRAAQRAAREAADELRRVSRDLRPSILHDLGLTAALRAEVSSFSQRSGIVARLVAVGRERRLDPGRELALLRIVQEALRNVEQHARARRAQVRLNYKPSAVRLTVSDDGQGMPDRPRSDLVGAGKLGLIGMGEQARLIDASMTIGASPDGGTRITVDLQG
jgi:PAS domain S-box-containing protein